jgi:hypothetical protein
VRVGCLVSARFLSQFFGASAFFAEHACTCEYDDLCKASVLENLQSLCTFTLLDLDVSTQGRQTETKMECSDCIHGSASGVSPSDSSLSAV